MSDVFISYSRKDIAFARLIQEALQQSQIDTWIDWERIPIGQKWWQEIREAIENANVFMFIISQNSVGSAVCRDEINEALKNNKRIIPIIVDDLKPEVIKEFVPELPQFNWIIFERGHIFRVEENTTIKSEYLEDRQVALPKLPQFEEALKKLSKTIHTDWEWVKYHTQLQVDALRWQNNQENPSYLVRGMALEEAERRLIQAGNKDPQPTSLQINFVTCSRQDENQHQKDQLFLEQRSRKRQRFALWAVGIGLMIALILGALAWQQKNEAQLQAKIALSGKLVSNALVNSKSNVDLSLLLNVEANNIVDNLTSRSGIQRTVMSVPRLLRLLNGHHLTISSLAISPDGKMLASGGCAKNDEVNVDCMQSEIMVWQIDSGKIIDSPVLESTLATAVGLSFSAKGDQLFVVTERGNLAVWDITAKKWVGQYPLGNQHTVWTVGFSPNKHILATSGGCPEGNCKGEIRLWNLETQKPIGQPLADVPNLPFSLTFNPESSILAVGGNWESIFLYQITPNGGVLQPLVLKPLMSGTVWSLAFSPDGTRVYASGCGVSFSPGNCNQGEIDFWDLNPGFELESTIPLTPTGTMKGQDTYISSISISVNNKTLASGSVDGTIQLWDLSTNAPIGEQFQVRQAMVRAIVFDPSSKKLYSMSDNILAEWDAELNPMQIVMDPGGDFVKFKPDSQTLFFEVGGKQINTFQLKTGENAALLDISASQGLTDISFSPKKDSIITASKDNSVIQYNIATGQIEKNLLSVQSDSVGMAAFNPDATLFATNGKKGEILLWDVDRGEIKTHLQLSNDAYYQVLTFSPDGKFLGFGFCVEYTQDDKCSKSEVHLLDLATSSESIKYPGFAGRVNDLAFSSSAHMLAYAASDMKVYLWNTSQSVTNQSQPTIIDFSNILTETYSQIDHLALSPDGKTLAVYNMINANVVLLDISTKLQIGPTNKLHTWLSSLSNLKFTPDGSKLIASAVVIDAHTGQEITTFDVDLSENLAISPDGHWLAVSNEANISLWDLSAQPFQKIMLYGHSESIIYLAFTPGSSQLFSLSKDLTLDQWDVKTGKLLSQPSKGYIDSNAKNSLSPDGKWLVSAVKWITDGQTAQAEIRFWNLETGSLQGNKPIIVNTADKIPNMAFSADSQVVGAYYCEKKDPETTICLVTEIDLWDASTHQPLGSISTQNVNAIAILDKNHLFSLDYNSVSEWTRTNSEFLQRELGKGGVSLAISHDQKIVAVGSSGVVNLWDIASGNQIGLPFQGEFGLAYSLDFSPDDKYLAAGTNSDISYVWQVEPAHWVEKACQMANRNLTQQEWTLYLGELPYHKTCPNNP